MSYSNRINNRRIPSELRILARLDWDQHSLRTWLNQNALRDAMGVRILACVPSSNREELQENHHRVMQRLLGASADFKDARSSCDRPVVYQRKPADPQNTTECQQSYSFDMQT